jgi:mono/diheme cytochrome c family protein
MKKLLIAGLALAATVVLVLACTPRSTAPQGPPATPPISGDVPLRVEARWTGNYERDIQPIFNEYCVVCHGPKRAENGLRLDSYEGAMRGTQYGPVVRPGAPGASTLVYVIQGIASSKIRMPHEQPKLTHNRIQNIIYWIKDGAKKD